MQVPVHNTSGQVVGQLELDEALFGVPFNESVVHQAMVRQMANRRVGTADTKTRSQVRGSTRKLYRQKHTGMARAGARRSPLRRGGGVAFGPHPRSYRQAMPKKMRRLALRCLLSSKVADSELRVVDELKMESPKTKEMAGILAALGAESSALVVTAQADTNVALSARNLPKIKTLPAPLLNTLDLLSHRKLVMTVPAVETIEALWGRREAA